MNRALRASHRRWWIVIGPLAAAAVLIALAARPQRPVQPVPEAVRAAGAIP